MAGKKNVEKEKTADGAKTVRAFVETMRRTLDTNEHNNPTLEHTLRKQLDGLAEEFGVNGEEENTTEVEE